MNQTLSDADINAIAERVLDLAVQRLSSPRPVTVPQQPTTPPAEIRVVAPPKLAYSLRELSVELGVSRASIYRLIDRGLIKPLPYLRTKMFPRQEVDRFLSADKNWMGKRPLI